MTDPVSVDAILSFLTLPSEPQTDRLDQFEREYSIQIPARLRDFWNRTNGKWMSTADVWTVLKRDSIFSFAYDWLEDSIEDWSEDWKENPGEYQDTSLYQLSKVPKERWPDYADNYLLIGSDFAAGICLFGIRLADLDQDDPPVYYQHECDDPMIWKPLYDQPLSAFLLAILCDVLACEIYHTAKPTLEENGWKWNKYEGLETIRSQLSERGMDFLHILDTCPAWTSMSGEEGRCFLDEESKILYILIRGANGDRLCVISRREKKENRK